MPPPGVFAPTEMSAVRTVVPRDQLPTALSQNQARQHVAGLVGGPAGRGDVRRRPWLPFVFDAVTYAVVVGAARAGCAPTCPPRRVRAARRSPTSGTASVRRPAPLVPHPDRAGRASTNLTINALFTVAILRMVEGGVDPWQIGLVEAAAAAAGILGAVLAPWVIDRVPTGWLTIAVAWSPLPLRDPDGDLGAPGRRRRRPGPGGAAQPHRERRDELLPAHRDAGRLVGRVQSASQFVSMASLPLAPLLGAGLLAALGGSRALLVAGRALRPGGAAADPGAHRPLGPRPAEWPTAPVPAPPKVPVAA